MVLRGQYLERPALVQVDGLTLEGLYHRGQKAPPLLLCPPAREGGGMDAPPLAELAWAAARAGHASLRFQHRGLGASQGSFDPARQLDDAEAAFRHLCETAGEARLAVAGLGSGCETALLLSARHPEVARLVLVSPLHLPAPLAGAAALVLLPEIDPPLEPGEAAHAVEPGGGRVEVLARADPRLLAGLGALGQAAVAWIEGGR
ncbi:MAG TPA: alpha/beta hydrolase [Anaeromyxobacteraceae bacterium]|nr:alpha/beta hydrolase [Anaeromyxobacteraceae bacterium]